MRRMITDKEIASLVSGKEYSFATITAEGIVDYSVQESGLYAFQATIESGFGSVSGTIVIDFGAISTSSIMRGVENDGDSYVLMYMECDSGSDYRIVPMDGTSNLYSLVDIKFKKIG